ncbi:MAG: hypothetical protein CM1200mP24_06650 [Gammaproteobacteria bacterium]|nr:MAG: hypothetical protein CM1200mP24_06650 [Gammaproteobacteria bacterium]
MGPEGAFSHLAEFLTSRNPSGTKFPSEKSQLKVIEYGLALIAAT